MPTPAPDNPLVRLLVDPHAWWQHTIETAEIASSTEPSFISYCVGRDRGTVQACRGVG